MLSEISQAECSGLIPFAMIKCYVQKKLREGKGFIWLRLVGHSSSAREISADTQGKNLKAGSTEEHCLLTLSLWLAHSVSCSVSFLIQPRATCSGNGTARNGLGPPTLINNQDNPSPT